MHGYDMVHSILVIRDRYNASLVGQQAMSWASNLVCCMLWLQSLGEYTCQGNRCVARWVKMWAASSFWPQTTTGQSHAWALGHASVIISPCWRLKWGLLGALKRPSWGPKMARVGLGVAKRGWRIGLNVGCMWRLWSLSTSIAGYKLETRRLYNFLWLYYCSDCIIVHRLIIASLQKLWRRNWLLL